MHVSLERKTDDLFVKCLYYGLKCLYYGLVGNVSTKYCIECYKPEWFVGHDEPSKATSCDRRL